MVKQGRILKGIGGFYYVEAEQTIYECKARGVFRKRGTTPLAGDWVQICIDNNTGTIEEIFPRKICWCVRLVQTLTKCFWSHLCVTRPQICWYWIK